jgi:predicted ATPase
LAFRFGHDAGVGAMLYQALALWPLGEVDRARSLIESAQRRISNITHIGTHAYGKMHAAMFELICGDFSRAAPNIIELARLTREHDLPFWRAYGAFLEGLATAESGAVGVGLDEMRRCAGLLHDQNAMVLDGLIRITLANAEARAGDVDRALAVLDEALTTPERIGHRPFDAELNRVRGEMLLKLDPASPSPAEEAFQVAIGVARQQGARSFELRAAIALARLYQSSARPAEAHAVLAPALDGFASSPEMPEIAAAQALLAQLNGGSNTLVTAGAAPGKCRDENEASYSTSHPPS